MSRDGDGFSFVPLASLPALTSNKAGEDSELGRSESKINSDDLGFFDRYAMIATSEIKVKRAGRDASGTRVGAIEVRR